MTSSPQKPSLKEATKTAEFEIDLLSSPSTSLPAKADAANIVPANDTGSRLTFQNATPEERKEIEKRIATYDLLDPEGTIIPIGNDGRQKLRSIVERRFDTMAPQEKIELISTLNKLAEALLSNSPQNLKKRLIGGAASNFKKAVISLWRSEADQARDLVSSFMTTITSSRKVISEMTYALENQLGTLNKNFDEINELGDALNEGAVDLRVDQAAVAEFIRRVNTGEITLLQDLEIKARETSRPDDIERLQEAQAGWGLIQRVEARLMKSITSYQMGCAELSVTKTINRQDRLDTLDALTSGVTDWLISILIFEKITTQEAAGKLLEVANQISEKSVSGNVDAFDRLLNLSIGRINGESYTLAKVLDEQQKLATILTSAGPKIEAEYKRLEADKARWNSEDNNFRRAMVELYSDPRGVLAPPRPRANESAAPKAP